MRAHSTLLLISLAIGLSACMFDANAERFDVFLSDKAGQAIFIGRAELSDHTAHFERDEAPFKDFFLSMKEMKCLEGPEIWCHIPYPYAIPKINEPSAESWLSHQLLFMYKKHDQFGAQLWQGVYFHLIPTETGYRADTYSVDLNELASPPEDMNTPPIDVNALELLDSENRWLPILVLRK